METKDHSETQNPESSYFTEAEKDDKVNINYSYVEMSPKRKESSSPAVERIKNIQNIGEVCYIMSRAQELEGNIPTYCRPSRSEGRGYFGNCLRHAFYYSDEA